MPTPKTPPHPTLDITCERCKFWHPTTRDKVVIVGNGAVQRLKDIRAAGQIVPAGAPQLEMAQCFFNPQWVMTASDSYCGHWESPPKV